MRAGTPDYAELHCLTNFTFLRGASHPEELVRRAARLGYRALAVTDECSVAGAVRAHVAAKDHGLPLIIGSEFRLEDGPLPARSAHRSAKRGRGDGGQDEARGRPGAPPRPGERPGLVLLAPDRAAYGRLSALIALGRSQAPKGQYRLTRADLEDGVPGCLALLACTADTPEANARWLAERFPGRAWLAVSLHHDGGDAARLARSETLAAATGLPRVATGAVLMHARGRRALQDTLTAIRLRRPVHQLGRALEPNGERHLRPREVLARLYPEELLIESVHIAERCHFSLDELRYEYPEELVPDDHTPASWLRALTESGAQAHWPQGVPERVRAAIEHELRLIAELGYEPYFLTVHDLVRFARSQGILCQGRGSAANSTVCYCLGVTAVDPSKSSLLFERFLSKERDEPPDIDIDFEHERREEVIQYVYRKYGRHRAALAATVISYRPRSALRDVGKALGLAEDQVDRLARALHWWDGGRIAPERLREAGFDPDTPVLERVLTLVHQLIGFPRHLSQHVGGFVISRGPLAELVPTENAAMAGRSIIQWDKDDLESLGLLKVDCLALGMLTAIHRAFDLLAGHRGLALDLTSVPREDPAVYDMLGRADSVGVFQVESRAQMAMLPRLRPRCFYDLVIEISIVRPGPIQGDMVHPYLRRREGLEPVDYPSDEVRGVLERTLGVPIFQEQVMQLAVVAAGFSPGEADQLRRAMAAWRRKGGLGPFRERLLTGMRERGYEEAFAERVFQQICGFGEYGFPESHAASFALLVYVSAWLKCHHPEVFACALINSQPMGFYAPAQIVRDARNHGVEVRPVDVTASDRDCTLEPVDGGLALRLGLRLVKGLGTEAAARIVAAREEEGPFTDTGDLARRAGLDRRDLRALADAGALASLAGHRRQAWWQVLGVEDAGPLLAQAPSQEPAARLPAPSEGEDLVHDYQSLGLSLGRHPVALLRDTLRRRGYRSAAELRAVGHRRIARTAGLVITRQRPGSAGGVTFITLEDETGVVNVVVWKDLSERQRPIVVGARLMGVTGVWERRGEVTHLIAGRVEDHSALLGRLVTRSRDFQ